METKKVIGIVLIVVSLGLGYLGVDKISNSSASVEVLNVKLGVSDKSGKEQGYLYLGLAAVLLGGGVYLLKNK
jgi:hypothetical protein